jgi:hypothetical protein
VDETKGSDPKPGSPEWQERWDTQVAEHDAKQRRSGNGNQNFEIGQGRDR